MAYELRISIPGKKSQQIAFEQNILQVGSLKSNQVVLEEPGVEAIHAIFEKVAEDDFRIIDLGSEHGIKVNGTSVRTEALVTSGDHVEIGDVRIDLVKVFRLGNTLNPFSKLDSKIQRPKPSLEDSLVDRPKKSAGRGGIMPRLFKPKKYKRNGTVLEVVQYWEDTVLEVDHYEANSAKKDVVIGENSNADFISGSSQFVKEHQIARVTSNGYKLNLVGSMRGKVYQKEDEKEIAPGKYKLEADQPAEVKQGAFTYLFRYINLPHVVFEVKDPKDWFVAGLGIIGLMAFSIMGTLIFTTSAKKKAEDEPWGKVPAAPELIVLNPVIKNPPVKNPPIKNNTPKMQKPEKLVKQPPIQKTPKQTLATNDLPIKNPRITTPSVKNPVNSGSTVKPPKNIANSNHHPRIGTRIPPTRVQQNSQYNGNATGTPGVKNGNKNQGSKNQGNSLAGLGESVKSLLDGKRTNNIGNGNFVNSTGNKELTGFGGKNSNGLDGTLTTGNNVRVGNGKEPFGNSNGGINQPGVSYGDRFGTGTRPAGNIRVGTAGPPGVRGGLTTGTVSQVIKTRLNAIRNCYERVLQRNPNVSGSLKMAFTIGPQGRVSSVRKVSGNISNPQLVGCVSSRVSQWKFPTPMGGQPVQVTYPFKFSPM